MKIFTNLLFILLLFLSQQTNAQGISVEEAIQKVDQICQVEFDEYNLPGMAISIMYGGEKIWSKGYGHADIASQIKLDPSIHMFRVGSISKMLTAALMAQLYEEKKLDIYAEVQKYVPDFPTKKYSVKVNEVAHHVGGIRHYRGFEMMSRKYYPTVAEGLEIFKNDSLINKPGTEYSYSSYGWNLISAVLEGASGNPFLEDMKRRVFDKVGMKNTMAEIASDTIANKVTFYVQDGSRKNVVAPYVDNSYKWAGGGFIGTTEDLLRFGKSILNNELYSEETQKLFTTPFKLPDGSTTEYGLGWALGKNETAQQWVGHAGGSVGGTTMFLIYPEEELVIAACVNLSQMHMRDMALRVAEVFLEIKE